EGPEYGDRPARRAVLVSGRLRDHHHGDHAWRKPAVLRFGVGGPACHSLPIPPRGTDAGWVAFSPPRDGPVCGGHRARTWKDWHSGRSIAAGWRDCRAGWGG